MSQESNPQDDLDLRIALFLDGVDEETRKFLQEWPFYFMACLGNKDLQRIFGMLTDDEDNETPPQLSER